MLNNNHVFINCPFDSEYVPLLRAMLFTIIYLDYKPFISQTISSAQVRNNQIKQYIRSCRYGIHDLSRCHCMHKDDLPRFNMPYELGLDIGASEFGPISLRSKRILILEKEKYFYQKVISDISGQDIFNHDDNPKLLIKSIRDWFSNNTDSLIISYNNIWDAYNQFTEDLFLNNNQQNDLTTFNELTIGDYIKLATLWTKQFRLYN